MPVLSNPHRAAPECMCSFNPRKAVLCLFIMPQQVVHRPRFPVCLSQVFLRLVQMPPQHRQVTVAHHPLQTVDVRPIPKRVQGKASPEAMQRERINLCPWFSPPEDVAKARVGNPLRVLQYYM